MQTCFTCRTDPLALSQGNTGLATSKTDVDSLGLLTLSYGNQGLNPSLVVESECLARNGTVDCTGDTVQVSETTALFLPNADWLDSPRGTSASRSEHLHLGKAV